MFVHNFAKYWPILKLVSLLDSAVIATRSVIFPTDLKCVDTLPCEIQKITIANQKLTPYLGPI